MLLPDLEGGSEGEEEGTEEEGGEAEGVLPPPLDMKAE